VLSEFQSLIRGKTLFVTGSENAYSYGAETVREATLEDAEALHALARDLADALGDQRPRREAVRERLGELLEEPRAQVLVAEVEDGIVGAANLWIKPDLAHGDSVLEVPMLVVSENARRRGVGKLLVEKIQSIAAAESVTLIELVATRENAAARAFYRSLGFVETEHIALEYVGDVQNPPDPDEE
jgi:ribosomal protein S18 acetylase RimI-like enzyme